MQARSESRNNPNRQCCAVNTHMAILSVITRVLNVRYQASLAFVTGSCPFCDCSCQFVSRTKEFLVYQFVPLFGISGRFESMFFDNSPTVSKQLLCLSIRQFTMPFNALFNRTFLVTIASDSFRLRSLPARLLLSCSRQRFVIRTFFCVHESHFRSIRIHVNCIPSTHVVKK